MCSYGYTSIFDGRIVLCLIFDGPRPGDDQESVNDAAMRSRRR